MTHKNDNHGSQLLEQHTAIADREPAVDDVAARWNRLKAPHGDAPRLCQEKPGRMQMVGEYNLLLIWLGVRGDRILAWLSPPLPLLKALSPLLPAVLLLAGIALIVWTTAIPIVHSLAAGRWDERPCTVLLDEVSVSRGGRGGPAYRLCFLYEYEVGGRPYRSSRIDFSNAVSLSREGKDDFIARHRVGSRTSCRVNPNDPLNAVFDPSVPGSVLFGLFGLIPLAGGASSCIAGAKPDQNARGLRQATEADGRDDARRGVRHPGGAAVRQVAAPQAQPVARECEVREAAFRIHGRPAYRPSWLRRAGEPVAGGILSRLRIRGRQRSLAEEEGRQRV